MKFTSTQREQPGICDAAFTLSVQCLPAVCDLSIVVYLASGDAIRSSSGGLSQRALWWCLSD